MPQRLADIMLETKNFVGERTTAMESQFQDAQQSFHRLQMQTTELRAEINRIGMSSQHSGGGGGGHKKKSLMDPKNVTRKLRTPLMNGEMTWRSTSIPSAPT